MHVYFFLRSYNDIDSSTPVAFKLLQSDHQVTFVNINFIQSFANDFRIQFLQSFRNFDHTHFVPPATKASSAFHGYLDKFSQFSRTLREKIKKEQVKIWGQLNAEAILDPDQADQALFVLTYNNSYIFSSLLDSAKGLGIPSVIITNSLYTPSNALWTYKLGVPNLRKSSVSERCCAHFVHNEHFKKISIEWGVPPDKLQVMGAPRYAQEWQPVLERITPSSPIFKQPGQRRAVVLLSKWKYNIWEEETLRTLSTLAQMKDLQLVIKPHTRGMNIQGLEKRENVFVADNSYHSKTIIQSSDIIFFSISSIFLDGLYHKKPVYHLRNTCANPLQCRDIFSNWNIDCRDDLYKAVERLSEKVMPYTLEQSRATYNLYVNDHNGDLLTRFAVRLEELHYKHGGHRS